MRNFLFIFLIFLFLSTGCVEITKKPVPPSVPEISQPAPFSVGQWVSYQIRRYVKYSPEDAPRNLSEATMKISIVGKKIIKDKEYYWIEYLINEGTEQQRVVKFMIDNEGVSQPIKLVMKYGNLQAVEIELRRWGVRTRLTADMLFHQMTRRFDILPLVKPVHSGKTEEETIQINLSGRETRLKCEKIILDELEYGMDGFIWYASDLPLAGLAKAFFIEGEYRTHLLLTAYGNSGAKSVITEQPKKLNFRE